MIKLKKRSKRNRNMSTQLSTHKSTFIIIFFSAVFIDLTTMDDCKSLSMLNWYVCISMNNHIEDKYIKTSANKDEAVKSGTLQQQ